jgi:hypothetical protein
MAAAARQISRISRRDFPDLSFYKLRMVRLEFGAHFSVSFPFL